MPGPADPAIGESDEWFLFVDLAVGHGISPDVYVVPRNHVAALGCAQKAVDPKSGGKIINVHDIDGYRGAWKLLEEAGRQGEVSAPRLGPGKVH